MPKPHVNLYINGFAFRLLEVGKGQEGPTMRGAFL